MSRKNPPSKKQLLKADKSERKRQQRCSGSQRIIMMNNVEHRFIYSTGSLSVRNLDTNKNIHYTALDIARWLEVPLSTMRVNWMFFYVRKNTPEYLDEYYTAKDIRVGDMLRTQAPIWNMRAWVRDYRTFIVTDVNKDKISYVELFTNTLKTETDFAFGKKEWEIAKRQ